MDRVSLLLDVQDVAFSVGDRQLLKPVFLQLYQGDCVLLTGPSGSGKSTFLKILASLITPTSGQLFFRNSDITTLRAEAYRQQVSYCFQTPQLFGQTVYDNLALPWQIRRQKPQRDKLVAALESVNLSPDMLNKPVEQLSGGEKQRVGLLRNLQFMPEVLLLDEVTSALDEENRLSVLSLINRISAEEKVAVVRISHDVNDIQQAEQVLRLEPPEKENKRESA
ncbi:iron efflux ABC transporter ATP-binding subunit FetA [Pantoea agglomerans]|jgi:putative ABC transport system ATP-binding protein|uniref:iron efflux ABC transporter ATP-binding subunit FetA n=1 Tax=Enterobacter agglomerans TaxID=549 RepID=UPI0013CD5D55|nr:iron ABC transporter ATP-binding protein FetA [Pantoea agglomerans]MBD8251818.1 iron ABC transporter ATP-binding protein FetA [Pantoea agglomerans]MDY0998000.1 iron ABC transporter ATP-binding protein FetA [Pantoea agglomerans]NEG83309.1 iron ABC transporter ATP-binding protein FetA [Pantoea agglomerans]NQS82000.1 iron ABC transporter ATP-binding protein FetA [Pantoea agglomerans]WAB89140.1 iron ABC transporter ATP-binding protein FetA [Pantoea agglomerans]